MVATIEGNGQGSLRRAGLIRQPRTGGMVLLAIYRGLRTFFERLHVPDHALACVVRKLEILRQLERIRRTGILAQAAKHATAKIVGEGHEFLAPRLLVALARHHDQIFRARNSAQVARDTKCLVGIRVNVQAWSAPVSFRHLRPFQRILLGVDLFGILVAKGNEQTLHQVEQKNLPQYCSQPHTA